MALLGVLPRRNPLTDWHKIWHGWLRRRRHSVSQMACRSVQGGDPLDRFWRVMSQSACFWKYCIPLGVRTTISQFQGIEIPKNRQKLARRGIFQPKCQNLTMAISPKQ